MFDGLGEVVLDLEDVSKKDEAELAAIDAGAVDVEEADNKLLIYCDKDKTFSLKEKMETLGYKTESAELVMRPNTLINLEKEETREQVEKILEQLDELDDVTHVWSNYA
jgi:transcriptional/translational regulatory protein YebC/TACO1